MNAAMARAPWGVGGYLALLQAALALGWVVYAAYLPQLAAQAGLPREAVPWLLMADQLVFLVCDVLVGWGSDRAARVVGRVGAAVVVVSLVSALAFVALPAAAAAAQPEALVALGLLWAATSSALRAPPLALLGRYVARPVQPTLVALQALGLGVAGALAPYLALQLKGVDPLLPFALSAAVLSATVLGMVAAERVLASRQSAGAVPAAPAGPSPVAVVVLLTATLLGALAFQWHQFVAAAPLALRHVAAAELPIWLPVFWVGFNLALWPASAAARRWGAPQTLVVGAVLAAGGNLAAVAAGGLAPWAAAQLVAGTGWALLLCSAFSTALAWGGRAAGLMGGAVNAMLAAATLARIALVSQASPPAPVVLAYAGWAAAGFGACALVMLLRGRAAQG